MKLTEKQEFCLRQLAKREACTFSVCRAAEDAGINRVLSKYEWADAPFRELRKKGLIELTGQRSPVFFRRLHRITAAGREVLSSRDEQREGTA